MVCRLLFFYSLLLYKERSWVLGLQLSVAKILQNLVPRVDNKEKRVSNGEVVSRK